MFPTDNQCGNQALCQSVVLKNTRHFVILRTFRKVVCRVRVLPSLGDERWGGSRGNDRPEKGSLFPQKMTPLFELKRTAIRDALS